jgi:GTP pyrophosphokinase
LIAVEGGDEIVADETSGGSRRHRSAAAQYWWGWDCGIRVIGASDLLVKLAKCCTPVPGDDILGFVTRGSGISIHRIDCSNAASLQAEPERLIPVEMGAECQELVPGGHSD